MLPVPAMITQANPEAGSVRYSKDPTLITGRLQGGWGRALQREFAFGYPGSMLRKTEGSSGISGDRI